MTTRSSPVISHWMAVTRDCLLSFFTELERVTRSKCKLPFVIAMQLSATVEDDDDDDDDGGAIRMFNPYTWTVPVQHTSIADDNRNLTKSSRVSDDDDDEEEEEKGAKN